MVTLTTITLQNDNGTDITFTVVGNLVTITVAPRLGEEAEITIPWGEFSAVCGVITTVCIG